MSWKRRYVKRQKKLMKSDLLKFGFRHGLKYVKNRAWKKYDYVNWTRPEWK